MLLSMETWGLTFQNGFYFIVKNQNHEKNLVLFPYENEPIVFLITLGSYRCIPIFELTNLIHLSIFLIYIF